MICPPGIDWDGNQRSLAEAPPSKADAAARWAPSPNNAMTARSGRPPPRIKPAPKDAVSVRYGCSRPAGEAARARSPVGCALRRSAAAPPSDPTAHRRRAGVSAFRSVSTGLTSGPGDGRPHNRAPAPCRPPRGGAPAPGFGSACRSPRAVRGARKSCSSAGLWTGEEVADSFLGSIVPPSRARSSGARFNCVPRATGRRRRRRRARDGRSRIRQRGSSCSRARMRARSSAWCQLVAIALDARLERLPRLFAARSSPLPPASHAPRQRQRPSTSCEPAARRGAARAASSPRMRPRRPAGSRPMRAPGRRRRIPTSRPFVSAAVTRSWASRARRRSSSTSTRWPASRT